MVDRQILRSAQNVAVQQNAAATNSNRTSIDINRREGVSQGIEVRHRSIEVAMQTRFIYLSTGRQRSGDAPLAFFTEASMIFTEKAGSQAT